jgi:hypothetical protein
VFVRLLTGGERTSIYNSPEVEARLMEIYDEKMTERPVPYEEVFVDCRRFEGISRQGLDCGEQNDHYEGNPFPGIVRYPFRPVCVRLAMNCFVSDRNRTIRGDTVNTDAAIIAPQSEAPSASAKKTIPAGGVNISRL